MCHSSDTLHLGSVFLSPKKRDGEMKEVKSERARAEDEDHRLTPEASQQEKHLNQLLLVIIELP